jgi:hypothetical protein
MYRAVNDIAGYIDVVVIAADRPGVNDVAIDVQRDEVGRRNFIVTKTKSIDQEIVGSGYLRGNVVPDDVGETEHIRKSIARGQVNAHLPFGG